MATNNSNLILGIGIGIVIGLIAARIFLPPKDGHVHKGTDIIIDTGLKLRNGGGNCCQSKSNKDSVTLSFPLRLKQTCNQYSDSYAEVMISDNGSKIDPLNTFIDEITIIDNNTNIDLGPNGQNLINIYQGSDINPYGYIPVGSSNPIAFPDKLIFEFTTSAFNQNATSVQGTSLCELQPTINISFLVSDNLEHNYSTEFFLPHITDEEYDHHGKSYTLNDRICKSSNTVFPNAGTIFGTLTPGQRRLLQLPWLNGEEIQDDTPIKMIFEDDQIILKKPNKGEIENFEKR